MQAGGHMGRQHSPSRRRNSGVLHGAGKGGSLRLQAAAQAAAPAALSDTVCVRMHISCGCVPSLLLRTYMRVCLVFVCCLPPPPPHVNGLFASPPRCK